MPNTVLQITDGPDKPGLQWSLVHPGEETLVHFRLDQDAVDAQIEGMDEQPDGLSFRLMGRLSSGLYNGEPFEGFYSIKTRSGSLELSR
jgi:hypothetical protein